MYENIKILPLNRIIRDPVLTAQIYNMMYHRGSVPTKTDYPNFNLGSQSSTPKITEVKIQTNDRRQELLLALKELKSKSFKTKQDKESIGIIEATLKNGY